MKIDKSNLIIIITQLGKLLILVVLVFMFCILFTLGISSNKNTNPRVIHNDIRLERCPKCNHEVNTYESQGFYYVQCPECSYRADYYNNAIDAANNWNEKVEETE